MSEPTNAEMAEQEDMRLDAQIAELMEARHHATHFGEFMAALFPEAEAYWLGKDDFQIFAESFESVCEVGQDSWNIRPGSWYVVKTDGDLILCGSERESIEICADLGMVQRQGYAKHLGGTSETYR